METRRNSIPSIKACRFCLTQNETVSSLYDRARTPKNTITLPLQIMACVGVEVFPSDRMLSYICDRCRYFMDLCYRFKQICRQADEAVLQYIQNEEPIDPIPWPAKLSKLLVSPKRTKKGGKTEVDTSQIVSNDEESEEEGNVYNIKIGDGDDEDPTCIKVVKSGNKLHVSKDDPKSKTREDPNASKVTRQIRGQALDRPYPCQFCNKSFTKSHHYTRHMRSRHKSNTTSARSPFGLDHGYGCDQCDDTFATQDELIYHSAKHATENLTCPLCHETFDVVEQVSAHIKTHVDGAEFMCDFCELVFTSKEKLDTHIETKHEDDTIEQEGMNEDSIEEEDEFDDDNINVTEVGGEMIVEIKKHSEFVMSEESKKNDITNSEDSESEVTYTELANVATVVPAKPVAPARVVGKPAVVAAAAVQKATTVKPADKKDDAPPTASILRKAEEIKRKVAQKAAEASSNNSSPKVARSEVTLQKVSKPEGSSAGGNDKSLRLLEKELQELKRTNPSKDASDSKTPAKSAEILRSKRPQLHTSTPKTRAVEEKKTVAAAKTPTIEKKQPARVLTKENKVPENKLAEKETKATNNNSAKEEKAKEEKEKETPKAVKNGDREAGAEESVRRSSRGGKVKDYAKMIRDKDTSSDESDDNDEEYKEIEKTENRGRGRRSGGRAAVVKAQSPPGAAASPATRKRGRPRKEVKVPPKVKKANEEEDEEATPAMIEKSKSRTPSKDEKQAEEKMQVADKEPADANKEETPVKSVASPAQNENVMVSPKGTTLKKVAIKQLPPGVRPMPLPMNARSMGPGELCEMQIGKKVVKVQKIVMTKAEVEAMAKKGLVEMKDGTMVLKQGIKLPDSAAFKTLVGGDPDKAKSSPAKEKAAPTRCEVDDEV